jgi:hypothetical protein
MTPQCAEVRYTIAEARNARGRDSNIARPHITITWRSRRGYSHALMGLDSAISSEPQYLPCSSIFTGSDECIKRCRLWLQQCVESHPECQRSAPLKPPTRLIEILGPQDVRLVEPTTPMPYFALSYCWGGDKNVLTTTITSITQFRTSIPFASLALTIQDATGVTYRLGAPHIWIDSLCILQDDAQDWEREAKDMCNVYRNTTLTIGALGAARAAGGLFSRRDPLSLGGYRFPISQPTGVSEASLGLDSPENWPIHFDASVL